MRFLSHIRNFSVQIVEPRMHPTQYGDMVVDREGYVAQFTQDVTDADVDFGEEVFVKQGLVHGRMYEVDEVTPTPLVNRLSVFDTAERALAEDWDDDFREMVETKLVTRSVDHPDFRLVTVEPIQPPWPRYLDFRGTLPQLLERIVEDGYDVKHVLAYERQSGQRPVVIEALEKLIVELETAPPEDREQEVLA